MHWPWKHKTAWPFETSVTQYNYNTLEQNIHFHITLIKPLPISPNPSSSDLQTFKPNYNSAHPKHRPTLQQTIHQAIRKITATDSSVTHIPIFDAARRHIPKYCVFVLNFVTVSYLTKSINWLRLWILKPRNENNIMSSSMICTAHPILCGW